MNRMIKLLCCLLCASFVLCVFGCKKKGIEVSGATSLSGAYAQGSSRHLVFKDNTVTWLWLGSLMAEGTYTLKYGKLTCTLKGASYNGTYEGVYDDNTDSITISWSGTSEVYTKVASTSALPTPNVTESGELTPEPTVTPTATEQPQYYTEPTGLYTDASGNTLSFMHVNTNQMAWKYKLATYYGTYSVGDSGVISIKLSIGFVLSCNYNGYNDSVSVEWDGETAIYEFTTSTPAKIAPQGLYTDASGNKFYMCSECEVADYLSASEEGHVECSTITKKDTVTFTCTFDSFICNMIYNGYADIMYVDYVNDSIADTFFAYSGEGRTDSIYKDHHVLYHHEEGDGYGEDDYSFDGRFEHNQSYITFAGDYRFVYHDAESGTDYSGLYRAYIKDGASEYTVELMDLNHKLYDIDCMLDDIDCTVTIDGDKYYSDAHFQRQLSGLFTHSGKTMFLDGGGLFMFESNATTVRGAYTVSTVKMGNYTLEFFDLDGNKLSYVCMFDGWNGKLIIDGETYSH